MDFASMEVKEFNNILASKAAVPGGGGAAAIVGSLGAALGSMVLNLTIGKKKFLEIDNELKACLDRTEELRIRLMDLAKKDAEAFEPLSKAYSIPKDDPTRETVMEQALIEASKAPIEIMEACGEAIDIFAYLLNRSSVLVLSDVGVGVQFAASAMMCASLNVYINTKSMSDRNKAEELNDHADGIMEKYLPVSDDVFADVMSRLR